MQITPATDHRTKWNVRISFTDGGVYENNAFALTSHSAFKLALIDARMGSPFGSFMAPVDTWEAVPMEEVAV